MPPDALPRQFSELETRACPLSLALISGRRACGFRSSTASAVGWASARRPIRFFASATMRISPPSGMRIIAGRWKPPFKAALCQCRHQWAGDRGAGDRHDRVHRGAGRCASEPLGRLLSVVRSSRLARSGRNHRQSEGARSGGAGLVRRRLFLGMGFRQAPALAAGPIPYSAAGFTPASSIAI